MTRETHWLDEVEAINKPPKDEAHEFIEDAIVLCREYHDGGTHGLLITQDGQQFATLELPWLENIRRQSCIPEGVYKLRKRYSPVVQRSSGQEFANGWEVTDVPDRTYIMCHVANYTSDLLGCIGIAERQGWHDGKPAIWSSRQGFRRFMKALEGKEEHTLIITTRN